MATRQSLYVYVFMPIMAALALGWAETVAADDDDQKFPATGQTTVYRAGDDGDIQAGATLRYKDNRNGTVTDRNTGLVWEKQSDDNTIHDQDNLYTWDEAFDVHVATLNTTCVNDETVPCTSSADCVAAGVGGRCGFAGKRDWRLPNIKELQSIVNYGTFIPAVSSAFNTSCDPCDTQTDAVYWSSTTLAINSDFAWIVEFFNGSVGAPSKEDNFFHVRAVRSGSP